MDKYYYLTILLLCYSGPVLVVFFHKKILKNRNIKYIYPSVLVSAIPFVVWDILATWRDHWSFNSKYVVGINFVNIPIEELLFFMFIPQGCILLWAAMQKHKDNKYTSWEYLINYFLKKLK